MTKVKALQVSSPTSKFEVATVDRREVGPRDILIDIKFAGICHSDIHSARDEWGGTIYPLVPGHEIAGVVTEVGSEVTKFKVGDHAGIGCMVNSCHECVACQQGFEQFCLKGAVFTYNSRDYDDNNNPTHGGYSQQIVVKDTFALKIPDSIPLDQAAPLLCAGVTMYSPISRFNVGKGSKVAVVGLGGLGHVGVKLAAAKGAEVTVLSQSLKKMEDGLRMGATHYYATSDPDTFQNLFAQFDLILNTVSAHIDFNNYLNLLKPHGTFVSIGLPDEPYVVNPSGIVMYERNFTGSFIGGIPITQEMLDFCAEHNVSAEVEVIPVSKVDEAYERTVASDVRYRFVIDTSTF